MVAVAQVVPPTAVADLILAIGPIETQPGVWTDIPSALPVSLAACRAADRYVVLMVVCRRRGRCRFQQSVDTDRRVILRRHYG